jgi:putative membrane protein
MSKLKFSANDLKRIAESVKSAEKKTSGEISVAFIKESSDYAKYELLFAIITGFIYAGLIMLFRSPTESLIKSLFWDFSTTHLILFYGLSPFVIITLFYLIANIPFVDRIIIPKKKMEKNVRERASRYFIEAGVSNTRDRTGILIFLSFLERRVILLADIGVNSGVFSERSPEIISNITSGIKTGQTVEKLIKSIELCGELISHDVPIKPDDTNELKDDVTILET